MTIKQDGTKVVVEYGSERDALEAAATLSNQAADDLGWFGSLKRAYRKIDEVVQLQPALGILSWILLPPGLILEYVSWSNLFPGKGLPIVLGLIGALFITGTKFSAALWARALNDEKPKRASAFRAATILGTLICSSMASQLMASQVVNEDKGAAEIRMQMDDLDSEISDLRSRVRTTQPDVSSRSAEEIQFEIDLLLGEEARNSQNAKTGKTVGDMVGDCIGSSYYKDTYCDEVISWKRKLQPRKDYEALQAELADKRALKISLQTSMPETSGAVALGQKWADGDSLLLTILPGMLLMLVVAAAMVATTFLSKWNPKEE